MTKPPYKIPSIAEINSTPWNGLKVVETFAGGGGSDTGWRWSGYKTVWANEFEKNPCTTYRANHPETFLDTRDIKIITAREILMRSRLRVGELDVFSGSPPCQGFSIENQNRLKGKEKKYDNGIIQKNEDLFFEYIRLLKGLLPKVFVAENVKGLTIGKAKAILGSHELDLFDNQDETILHGLMNCGYVVRWQILNAADYGTPQSRQRVFFIGVRKDLNLEPCFPVKQGYQYSVLDALPHLAGSEIGYGVGYKPSTFPRDVKIPVTEPMMSISKMPGCAGGSNTIIISGKKHRKFTIQELKRLGGFPDDYELTGSYSKQWEIIGNSVCPPQMKSIADCLYENIFKKL